MMNRVMPGKKFCISLLVLFGAGGRGFAADQFGGFKQYATRDALKPFTRDLGGVLGSATFHSGRSLGFPGFDVGAHGGMQFKPSRDNAILRGAGVRAFGLPWVQAEIGMPFAIDGFIRGISYQGLTIAGGGLRYSLLKVSDKPWALQALLSGVGHSVSHADFSASHLGINLVLSWGVPLVIPYVGAGVDRARLAVRRADVAGTTDPTLIGTEVLTAESRFTCGATVKPYPFTYLQGAFTLAHGQPGLDIGLGIRF